MARPIFDEELHQLRSDVIEMAEFAKEAIEGSFDAVRQVSATKAYLVASNDSLIDGKEREIESLCLRLLLREQPVASDLRSVTAALKLITDLERIGDQAFDISDITKHVSFQKYESKVHIKEMANAVIYMVTDSVDSYVKKDAALAKKVAAADDQVDDLFLPV